ncbi:MAG: AbrB/MazE/SpoVT family DNA-binding domain-containing protein [Gemmatimonadetes bacterium]|nr:AbrB/MazE/SpoVT family DNA-binding domain-containing protein [Candidatus Palauibacter australiensis]MCZ0933660.1 AbrB/MazE/SpoVT family DNA-binding domain-containing protein [Candidatus Palauibacter rhopaloidicola]
MKKENRNSPTDAPPDPMSDPLPDTERVTIDEAGRLVVPARFRRALDIRGRQQLIMALEGDTIRLRTPSAALARLQAIARRHWKGSGSVVDEFILERRAEAARE